MNDWIKQMGQFLMVALGIFCTLFILIQNPASAAETELQEEKLSLNARAAVLMDADSGRILYGKEADSVYPMASTTKIMTLIVALENNEADKIVTASAYAASMPKVHLGVQAGERYRMEDLYYAMMLESFNDAAVMIAEGTAGSVEAFAVMMNEKAVSLGCTQTYFITPNGLDAVDEKGVHSSTAADMAKIMRYAIQDELFRQITQTMHYAFTDCDGKRSISVHNKNALLTMMEGVLSGKTGYTADAGYCYVCAVQKGDQTFIVSLLGSGWPPHKGYKWSDVQTLLDYGDKNYRYQTIDISKGVPDRQVHVMNGEQDFATVRAKQTNYRFLLSSEDKVHVESVLPGQLEAPVEAGQSVGSIRIFVNGDLTAENDYITADRIGIRRTWKERLWRK